MSTDLINPVHDDAIRAVVFPDPDAPAMAANAKTLAYSLLTLTTDSEALDAKTLLADVKEFRAAVEDQKAKVKAGPLDLCRRIDALVRPVVEDLDTAVTTINARLTAFAVAQDQKRREAEAAARAATPSGLTPEITPAIVTAMAEPAVKVRTRTFTEYRIVDHTKIPAELLELKTAAVKDYIKATGQIPPGIEVVKDKRAV